ncbi:MAG TPA: AsmA-like C-terminal region-containing protein, partial [Bacteroidia bacterium]|nr:AsmA-like C-terminal region-containing protein [Bacteroidia bacterium]
KFIDAWNFGETSSIYIAAVGQGEGWNVASWSNRGVIDLRHFRLNGVEFLEFESEYESDGNTQWFRDVALVREEGRIVAEVAQNDRQAQTWEVKGVVSTVDPVEGARAFNPKLAEALGKYRHESPPTIRLSGTLDGRRNEEVGDEPRRNRLAVSFSGGGNARYDFLGKTLTLHNPVGEVQIDASHVHLTTLKAGVFGGRLELDYDVANVRAGNSPFSMSARIRGVPLEAVTKHYDQSDTAKGAVDADFSITGRVGQVTSFGGGGEARISGGRLFAIPVLGPLSKLIAGNGDGGGVAKEASATFRVVDGIIVSRDIEALTKAFRVKAAGSISLVDQSVDLEAVVNARGDLTGALLTPVSELLTYSCSGTVKDPVWKPKHI